MFLTAIANPGHPEHEDLLDWYGDTFDSEDINEQTIKAMMGHSAKARPRKK